VERENSKTDDDCGMTGRHVAVIVLIHKHRVATPITLTNELIISKEIKHISCTVEENTAEGSRLSYKPFSSQLVVAISGQVVGP